CATMKVW
nr:immunoglobulin heavy chain junction region [Macaca mulatta]MOX93249.1 immunoglobulin heavy chain junction region [Macaca mulatta]MOX93290.1 immunoglobulin heavy chain junction region [Macaca mulatta]MOX93771.1 immunoglobulin heavy chain junction region [Macaca mulatta]MOX93956.1 immunoglobulin heavy chain junction region [Macaca mulatta]